MAPNPSLSRNPPASFFAGDTVQWLLDDAHYSPADGWVAQADISNGSNHYAVTGSDNNDGRHLLVISKAVSAGMAAGAYTMRVSISKGAEQFTASATQLAIRPNPASASDSRSAVKKALDKVDAWLGGDKTFEVAEYSIAGRSMKYWPLDDLRKHRAYLKREFRNEMNNEPGVTSRRRRLLTRMQG